MYSAPPPVHQTPATPRHSFVIDLTVQGRWIVRDKRHGIEAVFATQRDAIHFAFGNLHAGGDRRL
jgi:hypothetical protein